MKENNYTYPNIKIEESDKSISISTIVRKEQNGIWYPYTIVEAVEYFRGDIQEARNMAHARFHNSVYSFIVCGKISETLINVHTEEPVFKPDDDQTSEYERLRNRYKI